ncbi:MAG TPA: hypothetical protein VFA64_14380 [Hyphomicrobiaceae bacterium]|nr:hypothetical protein [Hyphomicrobiaceae bacterium]
MIGRVLRVIFGFVVACLAAGLTMVLFVYTPLEIATEAGADRVSEIALLALAAATHSAVFAAPFALIGAVFGEWQRIGGWLYYAVVAVAIAAVGFLAQFWPESGAAGSFLSGYAVAAFVVTGLVSGIVYWLFAGRFAARDDDGEGEVIPPPPSHRPAGTGEGLSARVAT